MSASPTIRIESLLSARLFLAPQWAGGRIYFLSNLGGHLSLYAIDERGSVPEPLLPPQIALQNPVLLGGLPYRVFPSLGEILVMIDRDGDENYQPMRVPLEGGYPEPAFGSAFEGYRVHLAKADLARAIIYLAAESAGSSDHVAFRATLGDGSVEELGRSLYGLVPLAYSPDHDRVVLADSYSAGDDTLYLWERRSSAHRLLLGTPLDARAEGQTVPLSGIASCCFTASGRGLVFTTALFSDTYGLGHLPLGARNGAPLEPRPVEMVGGVHGGDGEMTGLEQIAGDRYLVFWNLDGCDWVYEGVLDEASLRMKLGRVVVGRGPLSDGVLGGLHYDADGDRYAASFSTATSPTQIWRIEGEGRAAAPVTRERILGIPSGQLAPGEDASFESHDGLRVSARLYVPPEELGFRGPRPVVCYVHGGPQSQERPNFAWFSIPLIQFLALKGFAVFVPNARGSSGYGLGYMKRVDRDWGGQDRLDHVYAMTHVLPRDARLDTSRAAVVGRSYGGYMTLTLAGRHPELWAAAVDMFGPFDLLTFYARIPATWRTYFDVALGNPETDREFLVERSPRSWLDRMVCPLLVIQGKNDPRVVEQESRDLVDHLREGGKTVEYLLFENEGHDVLKFENRVRCYNAIADFLHSNLRP